VIVALSGLPSKRVVRNCFGVDHGTNARVPVNNDSGLGDVDNSADVARHNP